MSRVPYGVLFLAKSRVGWPATVAGPIAIPVRVLARACALAGGSMSRHLTLEPRPSQTLPHVASVLGVLGQWEVGSLLRHPYKLTAM